MTRVDAAMSHSRRVIRRLSRYEDHLDDFPTPPWATRALIRYVLRDVSWDLAPRSVLDPACGRGHMVRTLRETFREVRGSDARDYGGGYRVLDYVPPVPPLLIDLDAIDLVITNPPYKLADAFILNALAQARYGVAMLMRTIAQEGERRFTRIWEPHPPTTIAVFSRRMHTVRGGVVRRSGAMMSHSWYWWDLTRRGEPTRITWIPPGAQRDLERDEDYDGD